MGRSANHYPTDLLTNLPRPADRRIAVHVAPAAERAIRRGHPWLFASAIARQSHRGNLGDLAVLYGARGKFLAIGLYDPDSELRVRVLHRGSPTPIDDLWYEQVIESAAQTRRILHRSLTTGYRLVHGENDGLPGLIIDKYDRTYVVKLYTAAWIPNLRPVIAGLAKLLAPQRVVLRLSRDLGRRHQLLYGLEDGLVLVGPRLTGPVAFQENGLTFEADVLHGQKTGFYFDQRENRSRVEKLAAGRSVLNVFAYTGGFSLYAARGGASRVVSLDANDLALKVAARNFELNASIPAVASSTHQIIHGDAFATLSDLATGADRFDMVILDPPSFTRIRAHAARAESAYRRLLRRGLRLLHSKGILVAASCSSHISADTFFHLVHDEAEALGRSLHEIERTHHAMDHPIAFKEGAYLKCLFATAT